MIRGPKGHKNTRILHPDALAGGKGDSRFVGFFCIYTMYYTRHHILDTMYHPTILMSMRSVSGPKSWIMASASARTSET